MSVVTTGTFIVVEGIDGVGKSTLIQKLKDYFEHTTTNEVVVTKEPGGSKLGQKIRSLLLDPSQNIDPIAELLLFYADRAQHIADVIKPAMERNAIVLCDRYDYSTVAYQEFGRKVGSAQLWMVLYDIAFDWFDHRNHLVFYLHVDSFAEVVDRLKDKDRMENEDSDFYDRAIKGYLSQNNGYNWLKLHVNKMSEQEVFLAATSDMDEFVANNPDRLKNINWINPA